MNTSKNIELNTIGKKSFVKLIDKQPRNFDKVITDIREHAEFFARLDKVMTTLYLENALSVDIVANFRLIAERLEIPFTPKNIALIKSAIRDLN